MNVEISRTPQLALVVGGGPDVLDAIEPLLPGPCWTVEFVAAHDEPFGTVLAMQPDLVVVQLGLEQKTGYSLLQMLRLDPRTRQVPVLSYVCDEHRVTQMAAPVDESGQVPLPALAAIRALRH